MVLRFTNRIISPTTTPPTLVWTSPPHAILLPCTKGLRLQPNNSWLEKNKRSPQTRWAESIKHDLNYAGVNTTNAALMVFDRPQWKAFVSGLRTLEPSKVLTSSKSSRCNLLGFPESIWKSTTSKTNAQVSIPWYSNQYNKLSRIQSRPRVGLDCQKRSRSGLCSKVPAIHSMGESVVSQK